jgi:mannose-6-phosphate isomerase
MNLYPLKFKTIFKDKIWGGNKIKTYLNKDFSPLPNCGETWEVSGVKGNDSVVKDGPLSGKALSELIKEYKGQLVGEKVYKKFGEEFPLLIKFIDANDDLSIQVHPNDELAKKRHNSFGKTEMWYIIQADPGSTLISGFSKEVDEKGYVQHLNNGTLSEILNKELVQADDVFFLPAGRVHTIGKGLLLAEIQQTSDITYRIYDFDRVDDKGNKRELHTEEALAALDYKVHSEYKTKYPNKKNEKVEVVTCEYFTTNKLFFDQPTTRDLSNIDSFVIYICLEGNTTLEYNDDSISFGLGDVVLVPASIKNVKFNSTGTYKVLESYVP